MPSYNCRKQNSKYTAVHISLRLSKTFTSEGTNHNTPLMAYINSSAYCNILHTLTSYMPLYTAFVRVKQLVTSGWWQAQRISGKVSANSRPDYDYNIC